MPRRDGGLWFIPSLGRWFAARGHTARLIPAEFVKPFRPGGKNDAADAEAIAVAARQPTMRFVAIKSVEQQAILAWHSVRNGWQEERTALLNRTRGLLAEFGVVIARSADRFFSALPILIEDRLPDPVRAMLLEVREQLAALNLRLARCDQQIAAHARSSDVARRASELLGVGYVHEVVTKSGKVRVVLPARMRQPCPFRGRQQVPSSGPRRILSS